MVIMFTKAREHLATLEAFNQEKEAFIKAKTSEIDSLRMGNVLAAYLLHAFSISCFVAAHETEVLRLKTMHDAIVMNAKHTIEEVSLAWEDERTYHCQVQAHLGIFVCQRGLDVPLS